MYKFLEHWFRSRFSEPDALVLLFTLLIGGLTLHFFGGILAPIILALILAFLLDWPVTLLQGYGMSRALATVIVVFVVGGLLVYVGADILPQIWHQCYLLLSDLPNMFENIHETLLAFSKQHPFMMPYQQIESFIDEFHSLLNSKQMLNIGRSIMDFSVNVIVISVYAVLVPLMLFFFLKDKDFFKSSLNYFMPKNRALLDAAWLEMNEQLLNYIRGKIIEIIILGIVSYTFFSIMGLRYVALLALVNALSVLIPYIGAVLVTFPIGLVGLFQWGLSSEFGYLMLGYFTIQILDGNVLVPLLFSEVVKLHPVSIIASTLIFGGLWGVLGVFFAIPLASLVKTIIYLWPPATGPSQER